MRTVYWEDSKVKMIDQRILPGRFEIAEFDTVEGVARSIKEMYVRGAPAIGGTGGFGMALAAQNSPARNRDSLLHDLRVAGCRRRRSHPDGAFVRRRPGVPR